MLELRRRGLTAPVLDFETPPFWMLDHPGQMEAWEAQVRFLKILAGWQSGKTDFLVWWCLRQLGRRGPGDAVVAAPSYPLLTVATQPRLVRAIESRGLGEHKGYHNKILVPYDSLRRCGYEGDEKGDLSIWLKHTQSAKDVEAVTALWFAGDECGQMADEIGEAIEGRTSATGGDVCLISRPYFDNWFRKACEEPDSDRTKTVSFASWANPGWRPDLRKTQGALEAEIERLKSSMPLWRFEMKYGGKFTRPAGAIHDWYVDRLWDDHERPGHLEQSFTVPPEWERVYGVDFGPVHTAVRCYAKDPELKTQGGLPVWHNYRTYFPNQSKATWQHVKALKEAEPEGTPWPPLAFGGSPSEQDWRDEWAAAGLPVQKPLVSEVMAGIDAVYTAGLNGQIRYFVTLGVARAQKMRYSWEVDSAGDPVPGKIAEKATFHLEDAERYVAPWFALPECGQHSRFDRQKKFVPTENRDHPEGWGQKQ